MGKLSHNTTFNTLHRHSHIQALIQMISSFTLASNIYNLSLSNKLLYTSLLNNKENITSNQNVMYGQGRTQPSAFYTKQFKRWWWWGEGAQHCECHKDVFCSKKKEVCKPKGCLLTHFPSSYCLLTNSSPSNYVTTFPATILSVNAVFTIILLPHSLSSFWANTHCHQGIILSVNTFPSNIISVNPFPTIMFVNTFSAITLC